VRGVLELRALLLTLFGRYLVCEVRHTRVRRVGVNRPSLAYRYVAYLCRVGYKCFVNRFMTNFRDDAQRVRQGRGGTQPIFSISTPHLTTESSSSLSSSLTTVLTAVVNSILTHPRLTHSDLSRDRTPHYRLNHHHLSRRLSAVVNSTMQLIIYYKK
jgi:hypothetical protein